MAAAILIFWPKDCGYDASFIRAAGHDVEDLTCNCVGLISSQPFWIPTDIDLLAHTYCYGIKTD